MHNLRKYVVTFFSGLSGLKGGAQAAHYKSYMLGAVYAFMANENRDTAFAVYRLFFSACREKGDGDILSFLEQYEKNASFCMAGQRDYMVHSVNVFLLGLSFFSECPRLRREWEEDYAAFFYSWGAVSLLHDIAYPAEAAGRAFTRRMAECPACNWSSFLQPAQDSSAAFLQQYRAPLSEALGLSGAEWGALSFSSLSAFDHGLWGAVLLLSRLKGLLQPAVLFAGAAAALAHTLCMAPASGWKTLSLSESPLVYLLVLCTALENWSAAPDREANPVEEAVVFMLDEQLSITYIARNGLLPANFAEAKRQAVLQAVAASELFPKGISIRCQAAGYLPAKEGSAAPLLLPLSLLSGLASALYEYGRESRMQNGGEWEPPFEKLSDELKYTNLGQAVSLLDKVQALGLMAVPAENPGQAEKHIAEQEVLRLAEQEHSRWVREKVSQGWAYGRHLDTERKQSPYLLPHSALPEDMQQANFSAVRDIPEILKRAGLKAVKKEAGG